MSHSLHLTQEERYQISAWLKSHTSILEMARILNRSRSTIYREIQRNRGLRGYRAKQANNFTIERKSSNQRKLTDFFLALH